MGKHVATETDSWKPTDFGTRFQWIRTLRLQTLGEPGRCLGMDTQFAKQRMRET
jgi:hypothetical protein